MVLKKDEIDSKKDETDPNLRRMKVISFKCKRGFLHTVDRLAAKMEKSRSEYIRNAIDEVIQKDINIANDGDVIFNGISGALITVTVKLEQEAAKQLNFYAKQHGLYKSEVIRRAIIYYANRHYVPNGKMQIKIEYLKI